MGVACVPLAPAGSGTGVARWEPHRRGAAPVPSGSGVRAAAGLRAVTYWPHTPITSASTVQRVARRRKPKNTGRTLEDQVADMFRGAGCDVRVRTDVVGARGNDNVDVLVEFAPLGIADRWAVECKDQASRVRQSQVQTFIEKVQNIGASRGLVVATSGYQSGCFKKVKHTNIVLTDLAGLRTDLEHDVCQRRLLAAHTRIDDLVDRLYAMEKHGDRIPGNRFGFRKGATLKRPTGPGAERYSARRSDLAFLRDRIALVRLGSDKYYLPSGEDPPDDDQVPDDYVPVDVMESERAFCDAVERYIRENELWADGLVPPD